MGSRPVSCETTGKDRYKRWLARCSVGGEDVALWLAAQGWVFAYRDCRCEVIRAAVDRAQAQQLGIWSGSIAEPWEWRKKQK
jgi:endonuclease YncB( thermonuclease family)